MAQKYRKTEARANRALRRLPLGIHGRRTLEPRNADSQSRPQAHFLSESPSPFRLHCGLRLPHRFSRSGVQPSLFSFSEMEQTLLSKLMLDLRATCKYYTGYPKDLGPSKVIHFTSEREFVQLLHQGNPVVVAFTIKGNYTRHLDKVLEEAAAEFYPNVKFLRVECPKYPGFCITRQKKEYPFIEMFHSPEQVFSCMYSLFKRELCYGDKIFKKY